jgi:hypothetical protein
MSPVEPKKGNHASIAEASAAPYQVASVAQSDNEPERAKSLPAQGLRTAVRRGGRAAGRIDQPSAAR